MPRAFTKPVGITGFPSPVIEQFSAITPCPECGGADLHWLNEKPMYAPEGWTPEVGDTYEVKAFQGGTVMTRPTRSTSPYDHQDVTVIRRCKNCNARWGQR